MDYIESGFFRTQEHQYHATVMVLAMLRGLQVSIFCLCVCLCLMVDLRSIFRQ